MSTLIRSRVGRLKSRTGCNTCKIRRVKCGEEKPHCIRCTSTGRQCDYGGPSAPERYTGVPRILPTASRESRERRAFEYYFFQAAPSLSDALDLTFWRGTVLQICGSEPAVWDAIVALSTLYEHPPLVKVPPTYQVEHSDRLVFPQSQSHREALLWYSRSLRGIQGQIERGVADYTVALVTCVLFLCIEILQGNVKAALELYSRGSQLLSSARTISRLQEAIKPILVRIGTSAIIINGVEPTPDRKPISRSSDVPFTSLFGARTALHKLVADWKVFDCDCAVYRQETHKDPDLRMPHTLQQRQNALEGRLLAWYQQFCAICGASAIKPFSPQTLPTEQQGVIAILLMTYKSILILTRTGLSITETCYDAHEAEFADIIAYAPTALAATATENGQQPPFIFDMGSGTSLFITALKCRSPSLRRQALRFLHQSPPLQGMYFSHSASGFLAAIVAVEERGSRCSEEELSLDGLLGSPGCIPPESQRVFSLHRVPWRTAEGEMRTALKYSRREIIDGEMHVFNETVVLPARSPHKALSVL
ncbi:Zn(II)2Cys6 transcription factor [Aspergillus lucknowensis]|uniref:Zn(2)-C6 fungal-type domain-containing protein n=1 Tax=Aspergillus lucknowensis TaxID=176173 RepID=A0ABR4LKA8_9EURO